MFHTIPEAEIPIPSALSEGGERLWQWVEFGLFVPYFLATIEVDFGTEADSSRINRRLLLSKISQLESLINHQDGRARIKHLSMLSPCSRQGEGDYSFAQIEEIWESGSSQGYLLVLRNGETIKFPDYVGEEKSRLVFAMK